MPHSDPPTTSRPSRVLLASRPGAHRDLILEQLTADAYTARAASTPREAELALQAHPADLLILAGLEAPAAAPALITALRQARGPSLGILTLGPDGPGAELHHLRALEAGSDMHLPLSTGYVLIRAALTTLERRRSTATGVLEVGPLRIDSATVTVDDKPVAISKMQLRLLSALAARPAHVHTKQELMSAMWGAGQTYGRTRALDSHACRLRAALTEAGFAAIHTVWGVGYRLIEA